MRSADINVVGNHRRENMRILTAISALSIIALSIPETAGSVTLQTRLQSDSGHVLAQRMCAECHAVQPGQLVSPNPFAPSFETIANTRGMSAAALWVALHSSHRHMPNIILRPDDTRAIVAYILTMQDAQD